MAWLVALAGSIEQLNGWPWHPASGRKYRSMASGHAAVVEPSRRLFDNANDFRNQPCRKPTGDKVAIASGATNVEMAGLSRRDYHLLDYGHSGIVSLRMQAISAFIARKCAQCHRGAYLRFRYHQRIIRFFPAFLVLISCRHWLSADARRHLSAASLWRIKERRVANAEKAFFFLAQ